MVIWLQPDAVPPVLQDSRQDDNDTHVNGGSKFTLAIGGNCTTGFAWGTASDNYMIAAGHCAPTNSPPDRFPSIGVPHGTSWTDGPGSITPPGKTGKFGDIARIILYKKHTASIFIGGPNSTSKRGVAGRWSRTSQKGDRYCTGGITTGQLCNWVVSAVSETLEMHHNGRKIGVLSPATVGKRDGTCTRGGDSGGPVYTIRPDGFITGKGITSGGRNMDQSSWFVSCANYFTDLERVATLWGGDIKKRRVN